VIFLFMHGGPSQVDTFDYKPLLIRDHGKPLPFARPKVVSSETFNLLKSPWAFKQYGESGAWVSDCSRDGQMVDDICFVKSMFGSNSRHGGALLEITRAATHSCGQHGLMDHLRAGHRESEHAGYVTVLPHAEPRRREQLQLGVPAGSVRRHRGGRSGRAVTRAKIPFILNKETPRDVQRQELDLISR
jgi:hypothetical protein